MAKVLERLKSGFAKPTKKTQDDEGAQAHLDKLKDALDSSSDKNRNFLIVFLLLQFYVFIAVLGTTDYDLFLATSFYTFPFIQFKISLVQFYLVAPFLLLAFHFNLMFNFLEHCKKLKAWFDEVHKT